MGKRTVSILLALALIVLFGSLILWTVGRMSYPSEQEVPLQVLMGARIDTTLFDLGPDGTLAQVQFLDEGTITARARRHTINTTLTVVTPPGEIGTMLVLETPQGNRILGEPDGIRDTPAISYDGSLVAYAELALPFGEAIFSSHITDWHIFVMDVETGEKEDLGVGYAPQFIGANPHVLIYSTPEGIASYVINGTEKAWQYDLYPALETTQAIEVASSGTSLAAYNPTTQRYSVFTITQAFPLELSALGEPPVAFERVAFSGSHFYGLSYNQESRAYELWRYSYDEIKAPFSQGGELIFVFDVGQFPYQLIP